MGEVKELGAIASLDQLVQVGMATEEEQSVRLRAIQLGIASQTCAKIAGLHRMAAKALTLSEKCSDLYMAKVEEELPEMTSEELWAVSDRLRGVAEETVKVETRLLQGKPLFTDDTLSAEDRKLLRMFGNLKSESDRRKFIAALEQSFGGEGFEEPAAEVSKDVPTGGSYGDVEAFAKAAIPEAEVVAEDVSDKEVFTGSAPLEDAPEGVKLPTPPSVGWSTGSDSVGPASEGAEAFGEADEFEGL